MKKITLFITLLICSIGFSQNLVTNGDFQTGVAAPWYNNAANVVDLGGGTFVNQANVLAAGPAYTVNLSQDVALNNGSTYQLSFDAFTDATTGSRTMVVGLGQNNAPWGALTSTPTLTSTSQNFSYQFTINYGDAVPDRVIFDMGAAVGYVFIDNVSVVEVVTTCNNGIQDGDETGVDCGGSCPACPVAPMVAAPTPPARPAADVISLFSGAYTNIAVDNWNQATIWYPPTGKPVLDVMVDSNPTKKIEFAGDGFIGVVLSAYNNATDMTHFHMDYWVPPGTDLTGKVLNPKWSNHPGMAGEVNALLLTNLPTAAGSWVSLDVPLSTFTPQGTTPSLNREALKEFLITSNLGDVYIDNIYLHKNTVLSTDSFETSKVKLYPNPATNILNIEAASTIESVTIFNILGQKVVSNNPNSALVTLNVSNLQSGVYVIKTVSEGVTSTQRFIKE
jgi:endoglucanase